MSTLVVDAIENSDAETPFQPTAGTAQATTSGTAFDFTGIPDWAKRIAVLFDGVSLSGTDNVLVQIGDAGGFETSGYVSSTSNGSTTNSSTAGFVLRLAGAAGLLSGRLVLDLVDTLDWVSSHAGKIGTSFAIFGGGNKTLSATLTQVRVTRSGTDTFDAGQVNIIYE